MFRAIFCEVALSHIPTAFSNDKSTLDQIMAWCHQATSHYLNQCWPRSMSSYGVRRPCEFLCTYKIKWCWASHFRHIFTQEAGKTFALFGTTVTVSPPVTACHCSSLPSEWNPISDGHSTRREGNCLAMSHDQMAGCRPLDRSRWGMSACSDGMDGLKLVDLLWRITQSIADFFVGFYWVQMFESGFTFAVCCSNWKHVSKLWIWKCLATKQVISINSL